MPDSFRLDDARLSERVNLFPESVIREMTRHAMMHDAVNLAQGFPDWEPPEDAVAAAQKALAGGFNQYAVTWGAPELREAIAKRVNREYALGIDANANVTVTCGATEAMMCAMMALVNPGDEVVVLEPFYENYGPDAVLSGATPRYVPLYPEKGYRWDEEELKAAFNEKTKAIIVNTPNNPSGRVLTRQELKQIADLCVQHDVVAVTDEIYDFLCYDEHHHVPLARLPGMRDRTITIQGASKVFSMTGWRVAWMIAPPVLSQALRRVHDFLTVGAPHPLQIGVAHALTLPSTYYDELKAKYDAQRHVLVNALQKAGFKCDAPEGAYYVLSDFSDVDAPASAKTDDHAFAEWLVSEVGVAGVPGSSFFSRPELGRNLLRFHFAKSEPVLRAAEGKLAVLGGE